MELRSYQRDAVERVIGAIERKPILTSPVASGKTRTAVAIVERLNVPTLWLAHRKELVEQAARQLRDHGLTVGVIKAGIDPAPDAPVQVASVQTLIRRKKPRAGLIVVDECHHVPAAGYQAILSGYPEARVVGLTATPFRLDGRGLGEFFGELVVAAYADELCDAGVLHRPKVWTSKSPDLRNLKVMAGDYRVGALAERSNRPELTADIVETWQKRAAGRRTVAFACDVAHSRAIATAFVAAGVPAEHLDGSMPGHERDAILERLRTGQTLVVSNCMILTEGWDLPALECAIIARPTASLNLHIQMLGRVMRASPGKDCIVLDHAGNHHVHGLVTRRLNYSLNGERAGRSEPLGLRRCRACGLLFEMHRYACPECGWTPSPADTRRERLPVHGHGELVEFADTFEYRRQVWNLIESQRQAMGYREGWSLYRFREHFGELPVVAGGELIDPRYATVEQKRAVYERLLATAVQRGYAEGWSSHRYRELFGCWPRGFVNEVRVMARLRNRLQEVSA